MKNRPNRSDEWLTLAQAARRLNVHPTTLRRWANNGDIRVMLTPGGHRRFAASDVLRFASERHAIRPVDGIEQIWASEALEQTRRRMVDQRSPDWMSRFDEKARKQHRALGQRLMELILQYVSDSNGDVLLNEARAIGREYATHALRLELPLKQALAASMFFRDALVGSTMELPDKVKISTEDKMRLLGRINKLLNTVQLTVAEVYDANAADRLPGS
ncbi:MAG: helix-turn-helix domain-containing protein [Candidatus Krumholzibacteriia bacterium]